MAKVEAPKDLKAQQVAKPVPTMAPKLSAPLTPPASQSPAPKTAAQLTPALSQPVSQTAPTAQSLADSAAPRPQSIPDHPAAVPAQMYEVEDKEQPLVLRCVGVTWEDRTVKVVENVIVGKSREVGLHDAVRRVATVTFESKNTDDKFLPNGSVVIRTMDLVPFEGGKLYSLELSEVKE